MPEFEPGPAQIHVGGEEQAQGRHRVGHAVELAAQLGAEMLPSDQFPESHFGVGVRDDITGAGLAPVGEAHTDGASVFDQDFVHRRAQAQLPACILQSARKSPRQSKGATERIVAAVEIMMGDASLEKGRDLRRGQAVVARLAGQDALEHGIGQMGIRAGPDR